MEAIEALHQDDQIFRPWRRRQKIALPPTWRWRGLAAPWRAARIRECRISTVTTRASPQEKTPAWLSRVVDSSAKSDRRAISVGNLEHLTGNDAEPRREARTKFDDEARSSIAQYTPGRDRRCGSNDASLMADEDHIHSLSHAEGMDRRTAGKHDRIDGMPTGRRPKPD